MKIKITVGLCILLFSFGLQIAGAAAMNDYCVTPPYIGAAIEPNLLLYIDNSASMYDLTYTDPTTYNYCANNPGTPCSTVGATCSGTAYCLATSTTTTTTTTSSVSCKKDSDCPLFVGGDMGDKCKNTGQCTKSTTTVTTSVTSPVLCTTDADCSAINPGDTCNNRCVSTTHSCFDNTYNDAGSYDGLFVQTGTYVYLDSNSSWPWNNFYGEPTYYAVMPSTCTYGGSASTTPYICVNTDSTGMITLFVASGKFLNWLTMSKFDIEKKILTGGKYDNQATSNGMTYNLDGLVAETRGCSGRKFIKTVPGIPDLTFAIRGGTTSGIDKVTTLKPSRTWWKAPRTCGGNSRESGS